MSVTPLRPSSASSAQATRRVSFSPAVHDILETVHQRRRSKSTSSNRDDPTNDSVNDTNSSSISGRKPSVPSTISHRTRLLDNKNSPSFHNAQHTISPPPPPAAHLPPFSRPSLSTRPSEESPRTTTIEFSLKDIPLDGKIAAPIWREPSPGRSRSSRRASPARDTPLPARLSAAPSSLHTVDSRVSESPSGGRLVNPYTDLARDQANLLRRQRVVRTFFESHEDAVRLYIRLQQLLGYRDLCYEEFQQRLEFLNSEEEKKAAVAARAQRLAAQEKEIARIQAALAKADVTSPEFASSMNSLYSTHSGTPSERSARRESDTAGPPQYPPLLSGDHRHNDGTAAAPVRAKPSNASNTSTSLLFTAVAPPPVRAAPQSLNAVDTRKASTKAVRPPSAISLRPSSPREALEAWRRSRSQDMPSVEDASSSSVGGEATSPRSRGYTPRDSVLSTNLSASRPGRAVLPDVVTTVLAVQQEEKERAVPPAAQPRAPFGNSDSKTPPPRPLKTTSEKAAASGKDVSAAALRTENAPSSRWSNSESEKAPPSITPMVSASDSTAARSPQRSTLSRHPATSPERRPKHVVTPVAGLVTPPRALQPLTSGSSVLSTAKPAARTCTPTARASALADSPLARFRKQQGYADPVQHYRDRLSGHTAPLKSQPSVGSVQSSPAQRKAKPVAEKTQLLPTNAIKEREKTETVSPAKSEKPPRGSGSALVDSSAAAAEAGDKKSANPAAQQRSERVRARPFNDEAEITAAQSKQRPSPPSGSKTSAATPETQPRSSLYNSAHAHDDRPLHAPTSLTRPTHFVPRSPSNRTTGRDSAKGPAGSARAAEAAPAFNIESWSPMEPPMPGDSHDLTSNPHLVSSSKKSKSSSASPEQDRASKDNSPPRALLNGTPAPATKDKDTSTGVSAAAGAGSSVWDDIAALERRVGGLEGRTAELERNATKRAVLDAIRLLRERVTVLEDRTTLLESCEEEPPAHQLPWRE